MKGPADTPWRKTLLPQAGGELTAIGTKIKSKAQQPTRQCPMLAGSRKAPKVPERMGPPRPPTFEVGRAFPMNRWIAPGEAVEGAGFVADWERLRA